MRLLRRWGLATLAMLLMGTASARADITIDDFQAQQAVIAGVVLPPIGPPVNFPGLSFPNPSSSFLNTLGAVGQQRDILVRNTTNAPNGSVAYSSAFAQNGVFALNATQNSSPLAVLVYDGQDNNANVPNSLGGTGGATNTTTSGIRYKGLNSLSAPSGQDFVTNVGFPLQPLDSIKFTTLSSTQNVTLHVFIYDGRNPLGTGTQGVELSLTINGSNPALTSNYYLRYDGSTPGETINYFGYASPDPTVFQHVGAIAVQVVGSQGVTTQFGLLAASRAVPEPGSFALMGMGLAGLAVYRRRRVAK